MNQNNPTYENITGAIQYNMTNDYMFRAVLQKNHKVLTGLVSSLLRLSPADIQSIEIINPIKLGESINDKEFWLDVNIILNNNLHINLEMQVINEGNWKERSLNYLCRSYDSLEKGEHYEDTLPFIHIGFLDFTLFPKYPEFYATYMFQNIKNHTIYSDKLQLRVVELNQINLATEEDKQYGLDYWAFLFKAKTWEELKAMATKNEYLDETAKTIYELSSDFKIREECRRREDYKRQIASYERRLAENEATIAEKDSLLLEQTTRIAELEAQLQQLQK